MTGLAKLCMSVHPMASPAVCLVSIEVNSLTVTIDCSCLVFIIIKKSESFTVFQISVLSLLKVII